MKKHSVYDGKIAGPFASEQQFKHAIMQFWLRERLVDDAIEIENEEKEPGTPDVFAFINTHCTLYEFKLADAHSVITFEKTQQPFYLRHPKLRIRIIAWDAPRERVVTLEPAAVIKAKSLRFTIPESVK
jgi:hypothetical protein